MRKIEINTLPQYNLWVEKLLAIKSYRITNRTTAKIEEEYNRDKYKTALEEFVNNPLPALDFIKNYRIKFFPREEICISVNDELFLINRKDEDNMRFDYIDRNMKKALASNKLVVELGCGFGANLFRLSTIYPEHRFVGGEYCDNAIELASLLYKDNIRVEKFDYYDKNMELFEKLDGKAIVFTCNSVEQIPSIKTTIEILARYKEKIHSVFHFEPTYELYDSNALLGLLSKKYTEVNDYNLDLWSSIRDNPKIKGRVLEKNSLGLNPLNSLSAISWSIL